MTLLTLFWAFLKVGLFAFGGAYAAIPFMREVVMDYGWITQEKFAYFVAVSESTPGPVMVNLATYVGASQAGIPGALIATAGTILPAFAIMLAITAAFKNLIDAPRVSAVLGAVKPCVIGIIVATGVSMLLEALGPGLRFSGGADWRAGGIAVVLWGVYFGWKRLKKKEFSPLLLIALSAVLGALVYGI